MIHLPIHRRWAGKTSHVHLAPEHVFTTEHPEEVSEIGSRYPILLTEIPKCVSGQGTCLN